MRNAPKREGVFSGEFCNAAGDKPTPYNTARTWDDAQAPCRKGDVTKGDREAIGTGNPSPTVSQKRGMEFVGGHSICPRKTGGYRIRPYDVTETWDGIRRGAFYMPPQNRRISNPPLRCHKNAGKNPERKKTRIPKTVPVPFLGSSCGIAGRRQAD